jgi:hypothetical protein
MLRLAGEAYAALRYGPASARPDDRAPERIAALARMRRAIHSLPSARTLRSTAAGTRGPGSLGRGPVPA